MRLIQLGEQRDTFLSQVSHELRTPMTSIRSFSEILRDSDGNDDAQRTRFASIINDESIRLTKLLDEILELSFLESGRVRMEISSLSLGDVIDRAILATTSLSSDANARITKALHQPDIRIETDGDRLAQALINLLTNAIRHNDKSVPEVLVSTQDVTLQKTRRLVINCLLYTSDAADE
mgnify:CR=1 FL=1